MANQTKITADLSGLEEFLKQFGGEYVTRVGIIGSAASEPHKETEHINVGNKKYAKKSDKSSGLTNAELGTIHEFGSLSNNIPPRSFLRLPLEEKMKDIIDNMSKGRIQEEFENGDIKKIYQIMGVLAEGVVQEAFATGGFGKWQPIKQSTARQKGSSAILIDSSQLRRSISSDVIRKSELR